MSSVAEAKSLVQRIARTMPCGSKVKEILRYVDRETKLGARRVRGIWNDTAKLIRAEEMDALRKAAARLAPAPVEQSHTLGEVAARYEAERVMARLEVVERALAEVNAHLARHAPNQGSEPEGGRGGALARLGEMVGALALQIPEPAG
ncbi:hypothetical protein [Lichenihabitans psoromatis]|uniref:hypothetical protein n=1 Tax=Lichenihabitans psoromatis TaxID=2528642 RepID=UPI0010361055|nr:hypothetical protein [Lichenihabitans psoromatis]